MPKTIYCPECKSTKITKKGKQSGRQKYVCKECKNWFQTKSQKNRLTNSIVNNLTFKKRLLRNYLLALKQFSLDLINTLLLNLM
jgi:transposase-like protein